MTETDHFEAGLATLSADAKRDFPEQSPWKVNGVAIPENTVVNGGQNVDHFFPPEVLDGAAELLEGKPIVVDFHDLEGQADASNVIGEVTAAAHEKGVGLVFEGEILDADTANKIKHGYLDVSPTPARSLGEFDESMGAQRVERLADFRDLAVVANGQPGAKVEMGENAAVEALAMETLSRGFKDMVETDTLQGDFKTVAGVRFKGTKTGKLDESAIDKEEHNLENHYLYGSGDDKEDFGYPVVDADGFLRKGNVNSAHELGCRGKCPSDETHDENLRKLAQEFESVPEWAQDGDTMSYNKALETIAQGHGISKTVVNDILAKGEVGDDTGGRARELIRQLMDAGMTQEEIGSRVNRSADTISAIVNEEIMNPPESLIEDLEDIEPPEGETMSVVKAVPVEENPREVAVTHPD